MTKSPEHRVTVGPSERNRLHRISKEITAPQKESEKKGKVTRLLTRYRPYAATQQLHIHESLSAAFGRYWRSNNCHGSERDCEGRDGWWTPLFSVHTPKRMAHPHASTLADLEYGAAMPAWTPTLQSTTLFRMESLKRSSLRARNKMTRPRKHVFFLTERRKSLSRHPEKQTTCVACARRSLIDQTQATVSPRPCVLRISLGPLYTFLARRR